METKKIKKGDFIEIDYTGKLKDEGVVFDTTVKEVGMASNLQRQSEYKPITICVGEGYILPKIEEELIGKEVGKHKMDINAEEGFGKKSGKLLKLIPMKVFKNQDIMPYPGLEVNVDNQFGIVKTVSGGRVIVDFNHPLSGKDLEYEVEVKKFITDEKTKLESFLNAAGLHYNSATVKDKKAMVVLEHETQKELLKAVEEKVKSTTSIESINFITKKTSEDKK